MDGPPDEVRRAHRQIVSVEVGEPPARLFFRPLTADEARELTDAIGRAPDLTAELCEQAALTCHLGSPEVFERVADAYPLALGETLVGRLLEFAREQERTVLKAAVARWRRSERDLGLAAQNLLAFKAYQGGDASAEVRAGALVLADWCDQQRALTKMFQGFLKALSRRR